MSKSQLIPFTLVGLALAAMVVMVVTFEPKPSSPTSTTASDAPVVDNFSAVYDLRLTGTEIVPVSRSKLSLLTPKAKVSPLCPLLRLALKLLPAVAASCISSLINFTVSRVTAGSNSRHL